MYVSNPSLNIIVGGCGSGKSILVRYIMYEMIKKLNKCKYCYVFCGGNSLECYEEFIDKKFLIPYDPKGKKKNDVSIAEEKLKKIMKFQGIHMIPCMIVFDDILGLADLNNNTFLQLFTTFRHMNMTILIITQHINKVPPFCRGCAYTCMVFLQSVKRSIDALNENFLFMEDWKEAKSYIDNALIKDHTFLKIDMKKKMQDKTRVQVMKPVPILKGKLEY
jgi:archaellum biogenesis ATPase FlaH